MSFVLYILAVLVVVGLAMLIRAAVSAPEGYEDASGFHTLDSGQTTGASTQPVMSFTLEELLGLEPSATSQPWR